MIKKDSKKIIEYLLNQVISIGDLHTVLSIRYDILAKELQLKDENYCCVCFQYLDDLNYISIIDNENGIRSIYLTAKGIDFLESF